MCEFCTKHGEGQKWYLQMKNYSDILLHEKLSAEQKSVAQAETRLDWIDDFFRTFTMAAMSRVAQPPVEPSAARPRAPKRSEAEIVARRQIEHFGQVLPIEDVEAVIDRVDSITRMPCGCRYITTGKTDKRYCFGLGLDKAGLLGKYPEASSSLEVLDRAEAKKVFHKYDEEGLIHSVWTGVTPYVFGLCNCDRDCGAYQGYIEKRGPAHFFRAEYVCRVDWDVCVGCKSCMSQCQFGAQFYSSGLEKVTIDPTRCFGCGVCRAACPHDAIQIVPRREEPQAAHLWLKYEEMA